MNRTMLIHKIGMQAKATSLYLSGVKDAIELAQVLNEDSEVKARLKGKIILRRDAQDFIEWMGKQTRSATMALVEDDKDAKVAVAQLHEGISACVDLLGNYEEAGRSLLGDFMKLQKKFDPERDSEYPKGALAIFDSSTKAAKTLIDLIKTIKEDKDIKTFIRAGTMNVSNGLSFDEVLEIVLSVGKELGHPESEVIGAWSACRGRGDFKAIDIQATALD